MWNIIMWSWSCSKREVLVNFICKVVNACDVKRYTRYIQCVVFHLYAIRRINRSDTIKIVIMKLSIRDRDHCCWKFCCYIINVWYDLASGTKLFRSIKDKIALIASKNLHILPFIIRWNGKSNGRHDRWIISLFWVRKQLIFNDLMLRVP